MCHTAQSDGLNVACFGTQAAAQEVVWAKRMAVSDDRADHAEGMATAMDVSVKQLEEQLALRQQEAAARDGEQQGRLAKGTTLGRAEPSTTEPPVAAVCTHC